MMVHHDATLDRMTDGGGPLSARTASDLRDLRIRGSATARMPLLAELLAVMAPRDTVLRLELKRDAEGHPYDGLASGVLAEVDRAGMSGRSYITSFAVDYLRAPVIAESGVPRLLLVEASTFRDIGELDGLERVLELAGTGHFALPIGVLSPDIVGSARARGMTASAFGCHGEAQIMKALDMALPVFTTDRPSLALALREGPGQT
jgi:glycerophosphoryl diester phosphodiesterase